MNCKKLRAIIYELKEEIILLTAKNQNQESGIIECEKELSNGLNKITNAMYIMTIPPKMLPCF